VGVSDWIATATSFHCTSTERTGGKTIQLGIEVFNRVGVLLNDVDIGDGAWSLLPGNTVTLGTRDSLVFVEDDLLNTGLVAQGSARIFANSKNVVCTAMIVDVLNNPPTSMVMLPVFKATKQGGM
jgi:hypothetical protein